MVIWLLYDVHQYQSWINDHHCRHHQNVFDVFKKETQATGLTQPTTRPMPTHTMPVGLPLRHYLKPVDTPTRRPTL